MAQREVGLAAGEPPATRGYPPSVFAALPKLLERAGPHEHGTITGLYTVLVEGDDLNEPVTDHARSILDGHIVLTRELAERAHYPAIDVLASVSRCMPDVIEAAHATSAHAMRSLIAAHKSVAPLLALGAYRAGSVPEADRAIALWPGIEAFLKQGRDERGSFDGTVTALGSVTGAAA
jgi:flagellum-specific ATP synthase